MNVCPICKAQVSLGLLALLQVCRKEEQILMREVAKVENTPQAEDDDPLDDRLNRDKQVLCAKSGLRRAQLAVIRSEIKHLTEHQTAVSQDFVTWSSENAVFAQNFLKGDHKHLEWEKAGSPTPEKTPGFSIYILDEDGLRPSGANSPESLHDLLKQIFGD